MKKEIENQVRFVRARCRAVMVVVGLGEGMGMGMRRLNAEIGCGEKES